MVLLSLIIKKFLSRSLNAPLGCALNARKAVIGDYEQQKPFCPPTSQAHCKIVTFLPLTLIMSLGRLPDKKKVYFRELAELPPSQFG